MTLNTEKYKLESINKSGLRLYDTSHAFPRYTYQTTKKCDYIDQKMIVLTQPIKMTQGGLPTFNKQLHKSENDCMHFWLPLSEEDDGGKELFDRVIGKLDDEYNDKKINQKDNIESVPVNNLKYIPFVDNDADNKGFRGIKVKLVSLFDKIKKIGSGIFINDKNGNPKEIPENVETMEDLRKLFVPNCTVRFVLEFNIFGVDGDFGNGVKCLQMYISEMPTPTNITMIQDDDVLPQFESIKREREENPEKSNKYVRTEDEQLLEL